MVLLLRFIRPKPLGLFRFLHSWYCKRLGGINMRLCITYNAIDRVHQLT